MAKKKAAKESLSLFNKALDGLVSTAQRALNSGVSKSVVKAITSPVRGARATVGAVKKADEKLVDLITGVKKGATGKNGGRSSTVQMPGGTTVRVRTGNGSSAKPRMTRANARKLIYGPTVAGGTGAAIVGGASRSNAAAEEARKRRRSEGQIDALTDPEGPLAKRVTTRRKKAAAKDKTTGSRNGTGSSSTTTTTTTTTGGKTTKKGRRLKGKLLPRIRPFKGKIARALLGKDEQFGGEAGLIDPDLGLGIRRKAKGGSANKKKVAGYKDGGMAKKQGYNDRLDESLGERRGKESTKSQSFKSRRNESRGASKPVKKASKPRTPQSAGAAKRGWGAVMK